MASSVTAFADMDPSPRVRVVIDPADLDPSTSTVTVHQVSVAGDFEVRSMVGVAVAGGYVNFDYEVPFGVPVTYKVEQFDADGAELGFALSLATQVDVADGYAVLSDPLMPKRAVLVDAHESFGGVLRRSRPVRVYRAGFRTVALQGLQSLLEDVPLTCSTRTLEDADRLEEVLSSTGVLVRLMPSGGRLPLLFYIAVPAYEQVPVDVQYGGGWVRWGLDGQEVSRPEIEILVPVINYALFQNYMNSLPDNTYGEAATIWATYFGALLSPPAEV